jgi:hypothetical protein
VDVQAASISVCTNYDFHPHDKWSVMVNDSQWKMEKHEGQAFGGQMLIQRQELDLVPSAALVLKESEAED